MSYRPRVVAWSTAAAIAAAAAGVFAQDAARDRPTFRTEANYVRLDVYATRDGAPIVDLRPEDFEVLDEGVPQRIEQFEYVRVRGRVPDAERREPRTVAESREAIQDPRARVFVLFLDAPHVDAVSSRQIEGALVEMLDDLIGVDDLVGVMTPDMSARDVTFARKAASIRGTLEREWWGQRDRLFGQDPVEELYRYCYPEGGRAASRVAGEMIERRREKRTLDAFGDLVRVLRGLREERKALVVITQGWRLFQPSQALADAGGAEPARVPSVGVDPRTGRLALRDLDSQLDPQLDCERDRIALARLDLESEFYRLLDEANRANASFYPVDPRGLPVFDSLIGPDPPPSQRLDSANRRARQISLRTLAESTDGLAVVNTNNIAGSLAHVVEDLSSYYLLGYYARGVKMDGRFHKLTVRVNHPGVDVRARRGYLAPGPDEMALLAAGAPAPAPAAAEVPDRAALDRALGSLARFSRELPVRLQVAAGWRPNASAGFWVVGEVREAAAWPGGGEVDVRLTTTTGESLGSARVRIEQGARAFRVALSPDGDAAPGAYVVRVRARAATSATSQTSDIAEVALPPAPESSGAVFLRRGPTTGNRDAPTADLRFRRTDRLSVEVPLSRSGALTARLLDRTGSPLPIPVSVIERQDPDGTRWAVAQLGLAPLSTGDYVIEMSPADDGGRRTLAGFRLVP